MLPILSGILFKADKETLHLSSTDLEISIRMNIEVNVAEPGAVVIPARLIADILNNLEADEVNMKLLKEKSQLEVTAGDSRFAVSVYFEEDFPKIPEAAEMPACELSVSEFLGASKEVVRASSKDESKPVLTGVLVEMEEKMIRMVATDSYRLAVYENTIEAGPKSNIKIIVPARSLRELARISSNREGSKLAISLTENQAVFRIDGIDVISRLIDGEFPNYKQIIPETHEKTITVNAAAMVATIKRAAIMAQNNSPIRLSVTKNQIVVSAVTQDIGEATEKIEAEYAGDELRLAFNPEYLIDGITSVEGDKAVLEVTDPLKPVMIKPVSGEAFQYLIMPVRLT
jgi:DNA polymerase-3 subunit beta